jgi:hypothetical protein
VQHGIRYPDSTAFTTQDNLQCRSSVPQLPALVSNKCGRTSVRFPVFARVTKDVTCQLRAKPEPGRDPGRRLSRGLGRRAALHRCRLRPVGPQMVHRGRRDRPSRGTRDSRRVPQFRALAHRRSPPRARNGHGLPALLAAIGDVAHPTWRARSVGIYRLWRNGGFAVGALLSGLLADLYGIPAAIATVGALTAASGLVVAVRMRGNDHITG